MRQARPRWELAEAVARRERWRVFWHLIGAALLAVLAWGFIFALLIVAARP